MKSKETARSYRVTISERESVGWQTALTAPWTAPPVTSVSQRTMRCPRMLSNTAQSQLKEAVPSWIEAALVPTQTKTTVAWHSIGTSDHYAPKESNEVATAQRIRPARWTSETDMLRAF